MKWCQVRAGDLLVLMKSYSEVLQLSRLLVSDSSAYALENPYLAYLMFYVSEELQ